MKKLHASAFAGKKILILALFVLLGLIGIFIYLWQAPIKNASKQMANYQSYQASPQEIAKVKRNEKDYLYYYAADGKRYVFPDISVYKSWFGAYPVDKLAFEDIATMSNSPLGGNVFLRPGSLLQSPTLIDTFLVVKNGLIKPITDSKLLTEFYGKDWKNQVVILPDYYFSQYTIAKAIKSADDFPAISLTITIDSDKDLIKK